jgi:hypothetical protein
MDTPQQRLWGIKNLIKHRQMENLVLIKTDILVIPACPESFFHTFRMDKGIAFKKDSRQAGMTITLYY